MAYLPPEVPTLDELVEMAEDERPSLGNAVSEGELTVEEALEIAEQWRGSDVSQTRDRWRVEVRHPSIITGDVTWHCEHEHRSFDEAIECQEEETNRGRMNAFVYQLGEFNNRLIKSWREPDD